MTRIFYALLTIAAFASCANSYNIHGSSDVQMLDGRMLYLKVYDKNDMKNVDSCDVVHGQFRFTGTVDSARMATLCIDDEGIMPIIIEGGDISVNIQDLQCRAIGSPLNDKLTEFLDDFGRVQSEIADLSHKQSQAIMNGEDEEETARRLNREYAELTLRTDSLVTGFIADNFDNVLGPGVFFMMTSGYPHPELQPWIEALMSKATDNFKNDPYVHDYYEKAQQNEAIMNGMAEQPAAAPAPVQQAAPLPTLPTPNELASPADSPKP